MDDKRYPVDKLPPGCYLCDYIRRVSGGTLLEIVQGRYDGCRIIIPICWPLTLERKDLVVTLAKATEITPRELPKLRRC